MVSVQVKHNNHYVSQSYLRNWSVDGNSIWQYRLLVSSKNVPSWELQSIKNTAYKKDLYTEIRDGSEIDDFEQWLDREIEYPVIEVINRIKRREILSKNDWIILARYFAIQDLRTPLNYLESKDRWEKEFPIIIDKVFSDLKENFESIKQGEKISPPLTSSEKYFNDTFHYSLIKNHDPERKLSAIEISAYANRKLWLASIRFASEDTVKHLYNHKWSIAIAPKNYYWITSDNPTLRLNYYDVGKYDFKGGWGVPNGNLILPLTPKFLLFTQIGKIQPNYFFPDLEKSKEINYFLAKRAFRYIYSEFPVNDINVVRPRKIDPELFRTEQEGWMNWHKKQSETEK
jgi:hypothetical protein